MSVNPQFFVWLLAVTCLILTGCAPAAVGGAAAGGYKVGTDERSTEQLTKDIQLSGAVKNRLAESSIGTAYRIDVDVLEGNVTLTGVVKTAEEAQKAVQIAQSVEGVKGVRNNLQVGSRTFKSSMTDAWISSKIKSQLIAEPGIDSLNIDVDVYQGVATLTGIVGDAGQKSKALGIARQMEGVTKVVDNLTVR